MGIASLHPSYELRTGSKLATISGEEAMNKPLPVNPPELRSTFVAASSMPWQPTAFDGIEMKILYQDDEGRSTILFKMAPGAVVPLHEHTPLEQTFMLEGSPEDSAARG